MPSKFQEPFINSACPACNLGVFEEPLSGQEWHLVCSECGTIQFCYDPQPHQYKFHADPAKIKAFFGGYG